MSWDDLSYLNPFQDMAANQKPAMETRGLAKQEVPLFFLLYPFLFRPVEMLHIPLHAKDLSTSLWVHCSSFFIFFFLLDFCRWNRKEPAALTAELYRYFIFFKPIWNKFNLCIPINVYCETNMFGYRHFFWSTFHIFQLFIKQASGISYWSTKVTYKTYCSVKHTSSAVSRARLHGTDEFVPLKDQGLLGKFKLIHN